VGEAQGVPEREAECSVCTNLSGTSNKNHEQQDLRHCLAQQTLQNTIHVSHYAHFSISAVVLRFGRRNMTQWSASLLEPHSQAIKWHLYCDTQLHADWSSTGHTDVCVFSITGKVRAQYIKVLPVHF
jgi:hypothetical protein